MQIWPFLRVPQLSRQTFHVLYLDLNLLSHLSFLKVKLGAKEGGMREAERGGDSFHQLSLKSCIQPHELKGMRLHQENEWIRLSIKQEHWTFSGSLHVVPLVWLVRCIRQWVVVHVRSCRVRHICGDSFTSNMNFTSNLTLLVSLLLCSTSKQYKAVHLFP